MILDIHTHHQDYEKAVINASFHDFKPSQGLFYSLGIHPWDINKINIETALKAIETFAGSNEQVVAIGECGIDTLTTTPIDVQAHVFEAHIKLSERIKKPLIIHSVHGNNEIIRLHKKHKPQQAWIIHGFRSNNVNILTSFLKEKNIYVSIGENFGKDAVKAIPEDRLMLETDESTLSIEEIAKRVAEALNQTTKHILNLIAKNNKTANINLTPKPT